MRKFIELAADRLFRDLEMLIEERDRCLHALQILPTEHINLSPQTSQYQMV